MATSVESGIMPTGAGGAIAWSKERVTPEAAALWRSQSAAPVYRVRTIVEHADGSATVATYDVPGDALHAFVHELDDSPGETDELLSVEAVDGTAFWQVQE